MNGPDVQQFIERWKASGASERANYQLFLSELCDVVEIQRPEPARAEEEHNHYVFEKSVTFKHGDGTTSNGRIDLYKRGCFVLEAKQGVDPGHVHTVLPVANRRPRKSGHGKRGSSQWDHALVAARSQAEQYARALPTSEGWPPFLIVVDVGHCIELYADFSLQGKAYLQFPNAQGFRIPMEELASTAIRQTLRTVWTDPMSLDPSRHAARVTRQIAEHMAILARSLEAGGHAATSVAGFLMRCLFTMFAEDVNLIPGDSFTDLLTKLRGNAGQAAVTLRMLWESMNQGGFSPLLMTKLLRFNGNLFAEPDALPLTEEQLELLIEAGRTDWQDVEPAIFGTLLERALDPKERHKLGAHYTPRAYVERLVMPTIIEPLREEWSDVKIAAVALAGQDDLDAACREVSAFHHRLCEIRVLDPACGSGNFLYVTMEHMKRLEGEVLDTLRQLGQGRGLFEDSASKGFSVMPEQFLGIEANPMAAAVARVVLWIGYLQWHFRTRGRTNPPEPVLRTGNNIECRDAVLAWDGEPEIVLDDEGQPVTRWDGESTKLHPLTGESVPDDTCQVKVYRYRNPRKAEWPRADFIVGNPPFLGNSRMRQALGEGYVGALRDTCAEVPDSVDYVMYWWNNAAALARSGQIHRFGFITTNSLHQKFCRRVLEYHMAQKPTLSLLLAVADHPWVDSSNGAAVRISMTVAKGGDSVGRLLSVQKEENSPDESVKVYFSEKVGRIYADLKIGANISSAAPLQAAENISNRGFCLFGAGFIVDDAHAEALGLGSVPGLERHIRPYRNGRDLTDRPRGVSVIDLFGLSVDEIRTQFPSVFQWVLERVKPERDHNRRESRRRNWWIFGEPNKKLRKQLAGLDRYLATVETAKHRTFVFLDSEIAPDNKLICFALNDSFFMGVLSSRIHIAWALAAGGRLGVGNDPVYVKSMCFERFPFPTCTEEQKEVIHQLGEALDVHRKRQQSLHSGLTLTNMYNVLEKLRSGEALTVKEQATHEQALCSVLKQIHDDLDAAVSRAYGWPATLTDEEILERLVVLNKERAEEEKRGMIRWLRPEFQNPSGAQGGSAEAELLPAQADDDKEVTPAKAAPTAAKQTWPDSVSGQVQVIRGLLVEMTSTVTAETLARRFTGRKANQISDILETLVVLGQARRVEGGYVL